MSKEQGYRIFKRAAKAYTDDCKKRGAMSQRPRFTFSNVVANAEGDHLVLLKGKSGYIAVYEILCNGTITQMSSEDVIAILAGLIVPLAKAREQYQSGQASTDTDTAA